MQNFYLFLKTQKQAQFFLSKNGNISIFLSKLILCLLKISLLKMKKVLKLITNILLYCIDFLIMSLHLLQLLFWYLNLTRGTLLNTVQMASRFEVLFFDYFLKDLSLYSLIDHFEFIFKFKNRILRGFQ